MYFFRDKLCVYFIAIDRTFKEDRHESVRRKYKNSWRIQGALFNSFKVSFLIYTFKAQMYVQYSQMQGDFYTKITGQEKRINKKQLKISWRIRDSNSPVIFHSPGTEAFGKMGNLRNGETQNFKFPEANPYEALIFWLKSEFRFRKIGNLIEI